MTALALVRRVGIATIIGALSAPAIAQNYSFYDATAEEIAGRPGTIIRYAPFRGPFGTHSYRVLYRSTGLQGEPIAVSGVIMVPTNAKPDKPIVAWAHPTTGIARKCAPSLSSEVDNTIPGLTDMVSRGFIVAATDYPGLGTPGPHPYLVGASEARAVLDSVRAARTLPNAAAGNRFALWGHSQGGQAVLFAGEIADKYAPELEVVGIATAAPATELAKLFENDLGTLAGMGLTALTLAAWSGIYDIPLDTITLPQAIPPVETIAANCITGFSGLVSDRLAVGKLSGAFLKGDPIKTPPWPGPIDINTPGQLPAGGPVYFAQGTLDTTVDPPVTLDFANRLCRQGVRVSYLNIPGADHNSIPRLSATHAVAWMADRFAGVEAPNDCVKK